MTKADRAIVKRMGEIRDLLKEFDLVLYGYDPGVTAFWKHFDGIVFQFLSDEWKWLEPLLKELRDYRKNKGA